MDTFAYALVFVGALAGGFVTGLAGFGTALMALGIWLYVLEPSLAVPLVLICSVIAQTSTLPSMWESFDLTLVWPFLIGGLAGVPLGTTLVAHANPGIFKLMIGAFLLVFPLALHFNRELPTFRSGGKVADGAIGFAGGILGGLAGLSGPIPILWAASAGGARTSAAASSSSSTLPCLRRRWPCRLQTVWSSHACSGLQWSRSPERSLAPGWGLRVYRATSDREFSMIVLGLLFLSGIGLVWSSLGGK
jgi:uncharacterized protein